MRARSRRFGSKASQERRIRANVAWAVGALISLSFCMAAVANDLILSLDVAGELDARFQGLEILADIRADAELSGDVKTPTMCWEIEATGSIIGFGLRDILTLTSTGWFILSAEGRLNHEDAWVLRSLLHGTRTSTSPLRADDLLEGIHISAIEMGDEVTVFKGAFSGMLAGDVVPSGTIGVIRLEGAGIFHLVGDIAGVGTLADVPLDDPSIPDEMLRAIQGFTQLLQD